MLGRVAVLGGGISGLLLASALGSDCEVLLFEGADRIPRHKYWLSDDDALQANSHLADCLDCTYSHLDFIAYDGTTCRVPGIYHLWDTQRLLARLLLELRGKGCRIIRHARFYAYRPVTQGIEVLVNDRAHAVDLIVDCMGLSSPIAAAKHATVVIGFYLLYGMTMRLRRPVRPVGLHNILLGSQPTYFELFPTLDGHAHAVVIVPARSANAASTIAEDFRFIVERSPYRHVLAADTSARPLHGIIPMGRPRLQAVDRVFFYGEAGHVHPTASATGFSLILRTYRDTAAHLLSCIRGGTLDRRQLSHGASLGQSPMNRRYQEAMAQAICQSDSDRFRELVHSMSHLLPEDAYDLIFGRFPFQSVRALRLLERSRRSSLLARVLAGSAWRYFIP